ncbi:MAG: hypothetical protein R3A12_17190 [Ignavibacteria bacterium]
MKTILLSEQNPVDYGNILRTTNGGATWIEQTLPGSVIVNFKRYNISECQYRIHLRQLSSNKSQLLCINYRRRCKLDWKQYSQINKMVYMI